MSQIRNLIHVNQFINHPYLFELFTANNINKWYTFKLMYYYHCSAMKHNTTNKSKIHKLEDIEMFAHTPIIPASAVCMYNELDKMLFSNIKVSILEKDSFKVLYNMGVVSLLTQLLPIYNEVPYLAKHFIYHNIFDGEYTKKAFENKIYSLNQEINCNICTVNDLAKDLVVLMDAMQKQ